MKKFAVASLVAVLGIVAFVLGSGKSFAQVFGCCDFAPAPEIQGSSIIQAIVLVAAGSLLLFDRKKKT